MSNNLPPNLRQELLALKAELSARIEKIKADIGRGLDADSKEQAGQLENKDVLDALAIDAVEEIAEINAALARIDEGNYGICSSCGEGIGQQRLDALRYATECIKCAS